MKKQKNGWICGIRNENCQFQSRYFYPSGKWKIVCMKLEAMKGKKRLCSKEYCPIRIVINND